MIDIRQKYDFHELQDHLLAGDYEKSFEYVKKILDDDIGIRELYDSILKKSLYAIGELWESSKISVSTEHLASAIVETILSELYFKITTKNKVKKTAVIACTENEFHQIGIKMVSDIFELNGWKVHFLGANNTIEDIISAIASTNPDILALSLSLPFNLPTLEKMMVKIREKYPELFILIGGQAFLHGGVELINQFKNVIYKPDLTALEEFLQSVFY